MQHCKLCQRTLPVTEFQINRAKKSGRDWYCRDCRKGWRGVVDLARVAGQRVITSYKATMGCMSCTEKDPVALELHHRDPKNKIAKVGTFVTDLTFVSLHTELAKCNVLCANCHRKAHRDWRERHLDPILDAPLLAWSASPTHRRMLPLRWVDGRYQFVGGSDRRQQRKPRDLEK